MTPSSLRVLIAPNAFKGTLSAREAAEAIARGLREALPGASLDLCPVADGGDGALDVLAGPLGFEIREAWAEGPLGSREKARWGWRAKDGSALIEMAEAAGLRLLPEGAGNPLSASTRGVGTLLAEADWLGAERILLGVGGSATVDGGAGALEALGWRFGGLGGGRVGIPHWLDRVREAIPPQRDRPFPEIEVLCDVDNPLLGPEGAAAVFGPQKGASREGVAKLEKRLAALAQVLGGNPKAPGAGAAGGLAYGLAAALGAKLVPGAERVLELLNFGERLARADVVVTGEGRLDAQSRRGKAPAVVAGWARAMGKPRAAFCGEIEPGAERLFDLASGAPAREGESPAQALERAARERAPRLADLTR